MAYINPEFRCPPGCSVHEAIQRTAQVGPQPHTKLIDQGESMASILPQAAPQPEAPSFL